MRGRVTFLRLFIAGLVPVFIVLQPTGAKAPTRLVMPVAATVIRPPVTTTSTVPAMPPTTALFVPPIEITTTTSTTTAPAPRIRRPIVPPGTVALTFDDGPNETFTPQVLDILARYNVKATFFLVGAEVEKSPALVRRILDEGHAIGNHTWDHIDLTDLDEEGFRQQVDRTQTLLTEIQGAPVTCVRPPHGRINQYVMDQLNARGLRMMKWNRDTEDWKQPGVDSIISRALSGMAPGRVILMHDSGPDMSQTVAALPTIIEGIQAQGLQISPVCSA